MQPVPCINKTVKKTYKSGELSHLIFMEMKLKWVLIPTVNYNICLQSISLSVFLFHTISFPQIATTCSLSLLLDDGFATLLKKNIRNQKRFSSLGPCYYIDLHTGICAHKSLTSFLLLRIQCLHTQNYKALSNNSHYFNSLCPYLYH